MPKRVNIKGKQEKASARGDLIAADRTRDKLVESAGELFAEFGFYHATVRQICDRAEANVAAVNYHFGDKEGLYMEVLRHSMRAGHFEKVREAFDQNSEPEKALRAVVRARLQSLQGQDLSDWHFRIFAHELAKPTPALNQVVDEAIRPVYQRMRVVISKLLNVSPDHEQTRLCANSIIGQILFYAFARPVINQLGPEMKMTPKQVNQVADHIADFSLAYLRSASKGRVKGQMKRARNKDE